MQHFTSNFTSNPYYGGGFGPIPFGTIPNTTPYWNQFNTPFNNWITPTTGVFNPAYPLNSVYGNYPTFGSPISPNFFNGYTPNWTPTWNQYNTPWSQFVPTTTPFMNTFGQFLPLGQTQNPFGMYPAGFNFPQSFTQPYGQFPSSFFGGFTPFNTFGTQPTYQWNGFQPNQNGSASYGMHQPFPGQTVAREAA